MSRFVVTFSFETEADTEQEAEEYVWHDICVGQFEETEVSLVSTERIGE